MALNKIVVIAEDNIEDQLLLKKAFEKINSDVHFHFVDNGDELLNYLNHIDNSDKAHYKSEPSLILLDLNMPKMDGRIALKKIKGNKLLRHIPVIILSQSNIDEDIVYTYNLGCNSYIYKPQIFEEFIKLIKSINEFWLETAELPCFD